MQDILILLFLSERHKSLIGEMWLRLLTLGGTVVVRYAKPLISLLRNLMCVLPYFMDEKGRYRFFVFVKRLLES